jgi:alkylation response protein AidB-like acyl-CoA dehydrogenase
MRSYANNCGACTNSATAIGEDANVSEVSTTVNGVAETLSASDEFRRDVTALLAEFLPPDWKGLGALDPADREPLLSRWRDTLRSRGMLGVSWPKQFGGGGRGLPEESILAEECVRVGLPHLPHANDGFGFGLLAPTLLAWGTEEQKDYFLTRTISGEFRWAQGYSEPEAGSDLFGLRTRATRQADEWVINGQKIWQTAGLTANWIFALVRTDPEAVRSAGISFMLIPLDQPGVEVRGIRNMAGKTEFAEVFFNDARTPAEYVVGGVNNGAKVALTLLGYERGSGGVASAQAMQIELDRLVALAKARGVSGDPVIRQRIARCYETVHGLRCIGLQTLAQLAYNSELGPESSITKLVTSEYRQMVTDLAVDILGDDMLTPQGAAAINHMGPQPLGLDPESSSAWVTDFLYTRPGTVYGGSSEIQRNTIAEQILGLPREPRPVKGAK